MPLPEQPRLRRLESFPVSQPKGEVVFALRDPEGFSGAIVLPYAAAVLASYMDGTRTLAGIQEAFRQQFGESVALAEIEQLVRELDDRLLLDTDRFRSRWKQEIEAYLNSKTRPAAHAGRAYADDPQALRQQLDALFTSERGPGAWQPRRQPPRRRNCWVRSSRTSTSSAAGRRLPGPTSGWSRSRTPTCSSSSAPRTTR